MVAAAIEEEVSRFISYNSLRERYGPDFQQISNERFCLRIPEGLDPQSRGPEGRLAFEVTFPQCLESYSNCSVALFYEPPHSTEWDIDKLINGLSRARDIVNNMSNGAGYQRNIAVPDLFPQGSIIYTFIKPIRNSQDAATVFQQLSEIGQSFRIHLA